MKIKLKTGDYELSVISAHNKGINWIRQPVSPLALQEPSQNNSPVMQGVIHLVQN
jgi:hypothetical protein